METVNLNNLKALHLVSDPLNTMADALANCPNYFAPLKSWTRKKIFFTYAVHGSQQNSVT